MAHAPSDRYSDRAVWAVVGTFFLGACVLFLLLGFRWEKLDGLSIAAKTCAIGAAGELLRRRFDRRMMAASLTAMCQSMMVTVAGFMLAFCAARSKHPLFDAFLANFDIRAGYSWKAYGGYLLDHPLLYLFMRISYMSILYQPALLFVLLGMNAHYDRLKLYVVANVAALVITLTLFYFLPVTTAWSYLHVPVQDLHPFGLAGDEGWVRQLLAIRGGQVHVVSSALDAGIIGFPSFHSISALLNIWLCWPLRRARPYIVLLNMLMIASTPICGGHYLADVFAAPFVAAAALLAAKRMLGRPAPGATSFVQLLLPIRAAATGG
jgi:hypothetical protein